MFPLAPKKPMDREDEEKHSDMFLRFLVEHAIGDQERLGMQAAKDSLTLAAINHKGIAQTLEKIPS